jgi:Cu2+-containing amine oxidase
LCWAWIATIGNYEYGFNWVFHQDGTLEMEVMLSGFVETKALQSTENRTKHSADSYSHLLVGNLAGVHHQHFFNFRLDMDVDGAANSVVEQNVEPTQASPANPYGNDPAQMYAAGRVLERLKQERGMATRIVVDNGPEFLSRALDQWAYENGVEFHFIDPGKPIQNAYI